MMAAISPNTRSHDKVAIIRSGSFLIARVGFEWGNYFLPASAGEQSPPDDRKFSQGGAIPVIAASTPPAVSLHARKAVLGYRVAAGGEQAVGRPPARGRMRRFRASLRIWES